MWSCDKVNIPPAYRCLGLRQKHKSRLVWHGQSSFWEPPKCRVGSDICVRLIWRVPVWFARCALPHSTHPSSHFLSISDCGIWSVFLHMRAFLIGSVQVLLVRHTVALPLWWGKHWPLLCLAQLCSLSTPQSVGMTRINSLASSSKCLFHFKESARSLQSLDINISSWCLFPLWHTIDISKWGDWQHRWIVQWWRETVSVNLPFKRTVHRVDKLQWYVQIPWIPLRNTHVIDLE